ncbi:hypothetical protein N7488_012407 [Penicillium malachiteum]|nr:hypothetical protein N7488_012407 [Penicillium malachiteum]
MHFASITTLVTLLASTGLAAPAIESRGEHTARIQLANDNSGANANIVIPVDGVKRSVQELWGSTSVSKNGLVFASSAQLTAFEQTTVCTITEDPKIDVTLTAEKTWVSFGGVTDLCAAWVVCECEGM